MRLTVEEAQKKNERIDFLRSRLEKIRNERNEFQGSAGYDSNDHTLLYFLKWKMLQTKK